MNEEWRPVVGYEGRYEVSNYGLVRSLRRNRRIRKQSILSGGYPAVWISGHTITVHSLVAEAFLGPRNPGMQIRHLNGNPADPRASNLAYGTASENALDKIQHGTMPMGERHHACKLTDVQVSELRQLWADGWSERRLSKKFGITPAGAFAIARGQVRGQGVEERIVKGHHNTAKKLSAETVSEIRRAVKAGLSQAVTARTFSIDPSMVSRIVSGKYWSSEKDAN